MYLICAYVRVELSNFWFYPLYSFHILFWLFSVIYNDPLAMLKFLWCSRMQSVVQKSIPQYHTSTQAAGSLYSNTASFHFFHHQSSLIRINSVIQMYPCRPETMHVCAGAHTHTHATLNLTPLQLATTNWKVWRHYMVWTWQVWTPSPGLSLYTQSSGQLSQKRNHTLAFVVCIPCTAKLLIERKYHFVRSILFMTLLFHTLLTSCLHHTSCPCILRLGVSA